MLILVGSNHRSAPVEVRERMSFPLERLPEALDRLRALDGIAEALVLSTCNRVEVLGWTHGEADAATASIKRFLAEAHRLSLPEVDRYTYQLAGADAARHLFAVACGLDSMILGEPQILGQVKQAYRTSRSEPGRSARCSIGCCSTAWRRPSASGPRPGSRAMRSRSRSPRSSSRRQIFGQLEGRQALLLGAGKMARRSSPRHLASHGERRARSRAARTRTRSVLAERLGASAPCRGTTGSRASAEVDVVVSGTGAAHQVLSKADVARATRGRSAAAAVLIDIAVPRDVDPAVNELDDVYLYDIDGLQGVVRRESRGATARRGRGDSG